MRKKIKQLAYGIFDYSNPKMSLSTEEITLEVIEGKDIQGDFTVLGNGQKVRGIVYSTCTRMECLTPQFEGEEVKIRYLFHSEGLTEGDVRKGEFVIVCDRGEYNLSFVVSVSKKYAQTSIGMIKTLDDFVRLAKESYDEAYQVFYFINFERLLKDSGEKTRLLYETLRKETPSMQVIETFLVGIGQKKSVQVSLDREKVLLQEVSSSQKEQLCLKQDDWGYVFAQVRAEEAFIHLEKTSISSEDFFGSTCFFDYYIDVDAMHAGKNFGRIFFEMQGQTLVCEICAKKVVQEEIVQDDSACIETTADKEEIIAVRRRTLQNRMALMQLYIDYRLKKIVTGVWAKESIRLLDQLLETDVENDLYRLMKAQAFLVNRQRQEASWILEDYKRNTVDKNTPVFGYYLYLCTLMDREEIYVNHITEQIEELFLLYPDNSMLFWIRLFIREDYYANSDRRRKVIEQWMEEESASPYFYLEAYYLYMQAPHLLTKLEGFGLRILCWARRQNAITKDIAMQIVHLVSNEIHFNPKIFDLLLACYELGETEEIVTAICSYLIKGQKYEKEYHKWYVLGIKYEARITNLYEAFLLSADEENLTPIPKVVLMYFQYHNTLSYKKLALLYAYILKNRERAKDVYAKYRRTIEQFAISQIEAGHVDDNLAVIYKEMLPLGILNKGLVEKFASILFMHKMTVKEKKCHFVRAWIAQRAIKQVVCVPIVDNETYFLAYTREYSIILQDAKGYLYADTAYYDEYPLLDIEFYRKMAEPFAPHTVPYLLETYQNGLEEKIFSAEENGVEAVLASGEIKDEWKSAVLAAYIRQMAGKELSSEMEEHLQRVNYRLLSVTDRYFMVEQLIEKCFYEQAYDMMQLYGYDFIGREYLAAVCSNRITAANFEEEEFLMGLATDTFFSGKYDEVILIYLCKYYNGAIEQMVKLWEALGQYDIDTYDLEERIISQMLFTDVFVEQIGEIYESYCQGGGREQICMAYLTWFSHQYLVENVAIPMHVIVENERKLLGHQEMNEVQKFALLKYYSELEQLSDSQYQIADTILLESTSRGIGFSFNKKLDLRLQMKYQIYDKYYIEHFLKPGMKVWIHYCINGGKVYEEELHEVYDGIYVKEMVLYFGDKLSYYVKKIDGKNVQSPLVAAQLEIGDEVIDLGENRYTMLNHMLLDADLQDVKSLKKEMSEYYRKMSSTEVIFKLL